MPIQEVELHQGKTSPPDYLTEAGVCWPRLGSLILNPSLHPWHWLPSLNPSLYPWQGSLARGPGLSPRYLPFPPAGGTSPDLPLAPPMDLLRGCMAPYASWCSLTCMVYLLRLDRNSNCGAWVLRPMARFICAPLSMRKPGERGRGASGGLAMAVGMAVFEVPCRGQPAAACRADWAHGEARHRHRCLDPGPHQQHLRAELCPGILLASHGVLLERMGGAVPCIRRRAVCGSMSKLAGTLARLSPLYAAPQAA